MTARHALLTQERVRFVDDLISYMTLDEKLGQLDLAHSPHDPGLEAAIAAGRVGGVARADVPQRLQTLAIERSRLGIPLLISSPGIELPASPWALAASWDEDLMRRLGAAAADEALRAGANCLPGPSVLLGSELQGRDALAATSQAHLAARLVAAFAGGVSRNGPGALNRVLAIPVIDGSKPSVLHCGLELALGGEMLGLDCPAIDREIAIKAGYAGLLLAECHRITAIVADHFATTSARAPIEAAERAIVEGLVGEHEIDDAVRGALTVKHALGLFRRGERSIGDFAANDELPSHVEIARRSMVLLRNEAGLLPLSPVSDRILVVGGSDGAGGACAGALSRAGIGHSVVPGLAVRRPGESWADPVAGDNFALSVTRDAAKRADFVLIALDERYFARFDGPWLRPGSAVVAMLKGLSTTGARLVAIVTANEPVDLAEADQHFAAVLHCWGPGPGFQEALADLLSGRNSPQGRMPVSAGRFEFGQGLGYAESVFSSLAVSEESDHLGVSIRVRNPGSFSGRETVQVYVRRETGELRLVGFEHVTLAPGEDVPVYFELGLEAFGKLGAARRLELDPGPREILVGKNLGRLLSARCDISPALARAMRHQDTGGLRLAAG
ncbi:MAG TPA: glycoside hydrolase family 3 C-terminal domain-containing protein [Qipengyuania sp.]|nr:glycoside hydrolase family 3 C-terminal domain-containing protein [Qipengyuania sp.]